MKNNNEMKTSEADTNNKNNKNNFSSSFNPENNPLHKAVIEGISGVSNIYFETADKTIFEIIRGWYPNVSPNEMLVCWQAFWTMFDHRFPAYDEILFRLEKCRVDKIPAALRKEFHVDENDKDSNLFSSEWDARGAISQASRKGYIRYEITEYTSYGSGDVKPDPNTLVWRPVILVLLDDQLYKELDEATKQILESSVKQFFRLSLANDQNQEADS
jgi:hypothetical protein